MILFFRLFVFFLLLACPVASFASDSCASGTFADILSCAQSMQSQSSQVFGDQSNFGSISDVSNAGHVVAAQVNAASKINGNYTYFVSSFLVNPLVVFIQNIAIITYNKFSDIIFTITTYVFAIWILILTIKLFLGVAAFQDSLFELAKRAGLFVIMIAFFKGGGYFFWDTVIVNGASLSSSILTTIFSASGDNLQCQTQSLVDLTSCLTLRIDGVFTRFVAYGFSTMLNVPIAMTLSISYWFGVFLNFFMGLAILIIFLLDLVVFSIFILDYVFILCCLVCFAPFFFMFFMAGPTRRYSLSFLNHLISCFVRIIAMGFSVAIIDVFFSKTQYTSSYFTGTLYSYIQLTINSIAAGGADVAFSSKPVGMIVLVSGFFTMSFMFTIRSLFDELFQVSSQDGLFHNLGRYLMTTATMKVIPEQVKKGFDKLLNNQYGKDGRTNDSVYNGQKGDIKYFGQKMSSTMKKGSASLSSFASKLFKK